MGLRPGDAFPGDTIKLTAAVREKRSSRSEPDCGTVLVDYDVANQHGETVMTFTAIHIFARKGAK